jgi:hypothetical protein
LKHLITLILTLCILTSPFNLRSSHAANPVLVDIGVGIIADTANNLYWLKNAYCFGFQNWDSAMSSSNNLASGQCGLSDGSKAGDWHLPLIEELRLFTDAGYRATTLNSAGFTSVQAGSYWSGTNYTLTGFAWVVDLSSGVVGAAVKVPSSGGREAWPVRPGHFWPFDTLMLFQLSPPVSNIPIGGLIQSEFLIRNGGVGASHFSAQISGVDATQFSVAPGGNAPCDNLTPTLATGAACTLLVSATPTTTGAKTANLTITTSAGNKDIPLPVTAYNTVLGTVTDMSTELPVTGATVTLNTGAITTTDASGVYNFGTSMVSGTYSVTVSKTGYQSISASNLVVSTTQSGAANILLPTTGSLNITSTVLQSATIGTTYSSRVMVAGGTAFYTFSLVSGGLPTGLSLSATTGIISGTPGGVGNYTFTIRVTDSTTAYLERQFTIDMVPTLEITTTSLNRTITGITYPVSITATGGKAPLTFSTTSGILPTGLTLSTAGAFTGTPSTTGDFYITVTVTDSTGRTASKNLSLGIDTPYSISTTRLNDAKQGIAYTFTPATTGGYGTKSWSILSGTLPSGLSFDPATGTISGTPTEAVTRMITLLTTDSVARTYFKFYPLNVTVPVSFATTRLPNAYVNGSYSEKIQASGGILPYTYSISGVPTGLTYSTSTGIISGTATTAGSYNVTITVTDSSYPTPQTNTETFSLLVTTLITPTTGTVLTNAKKGSAITPTTFAASGGTSPYTWSHIGGALPAGVTFNPTTATLSGTPTEAGDFSFTLHLADSIGNVTGDSANPDKTFVLHVSDTLAVATTTLPSASLNAPYSATLSTTGGLKPVTWSLASGSLPAGISLDATTGQFSGTPTSTVTANFTVGATDSDSPAQTATQEYTFPVTSTMTIVETSLPTGRISTSYSTNVHVQAGTAPYNWSISSGSLPPGFTLAPGTGSVAISGTTPASAGDVTFTLQVTDSSATPQTANRQFTMTTLPNLTITTTALPSATTGLPYTQTVAVTGGQSPYTYTISSGSLPQGFFINSVSGVISGTLSSSSQGSTFTVKVTDSGVPSASVTKTFVIAALVGITVSKSEAAAGTVTSYPAGIDCDASCSTATSSFVTGVTVTLTAAPAAGYHLSSWSGCDSATGNSCTVTAIADHDPITASFTRLEPSTLTLDLSSNSIANNGAVTVSGILTRFCSGSCNSINLQNRQVTVTIKNEANFVLHQQEYQTTDTTGHFTTGSLSLFSTSGSYYIQATYSGASDLQSSNSATKTLLVGRPAGYAIIVQGKVPGGEGNPEHTKSTRRIYQALKERNFTDDNIYWLNYGAVTATVPDLTDTTKTITINLPVDDTAPTWAKVGAIISGAAAFSSDNKTLAQRMSTNPAPLYLIMVDHGSPDQFHLNDGDITPTLLDGWLNTLDANITNATARAEKKIIIIGSCYSGSFIKAPLSRNGANRTIIASAYKGEVSYRGGFDGQDSVQSGEYFLDELFASFKRLSDIKSAFKEASEKTWQFTRKGGTANSNAPFTNAAQHPVLDDNGDGIGSIILSDGSGDGKNSRGVYLGVAPGSVNSLADPADLSGVAPAIYLESNQTSGISPLWATALNPGQVSSVYVELLRPADQLTTTTGTGQASRPTDTPQAMTGTGNRFEYGGFTFGSGTTGYGKYEAYYYAIDKETGASSPSKRSLIYRDKQGNNKPTVPTVVEPGLDGLVPDTANSANRVFPSTTLQFRWNAATDPNGDPLTYTLEICTDAGFTTGCKNYEELVSTSHIVEGLTADTTYHWRVWSVDPYTRSATGSTARNFTPQSSNPLLITIHGQVIAADNPAQAVSGAQVILTVPGFDDITQTTKVDGTVEYLGVPLNASPFEFTLTTNHSSYASSSIPVSVAPTGASINQLIPLNSASAPVNGVCGSSNGQSFTTAPTSNLCFTGTASTVTETDRWSWSCSATNGGTAATCSTNLKSYSVSFTAVGNSILSGTTNQTVQHGGATSAVGAFANTGYHFVNWTGTGGFVTTTTNPLAVSSITSAMTITANFAADAVPVNGACGTSSGASFTTAPTANLCTAGTVSSVVGTGPWSWSCAGTNGGATSTCIASIQTYTINASATGGNGAATCSSPVNNGSGSTCTVIPSTGYQIDTFTDNGIDKKGSIAGGSYSIASVTANHTITATFSLIPPSAVNGSCGTSNAGTFTTIPTTNFCATGTASAVTGTGPWFWTCGGTNGGSSVTCSANLQESSICTSEHWSGLGSGTSNVIMHLAGSLTINGRPATACDEIAAYDTAGNVVGVYHVQNEGQYGDMVIYGDSSTSANVDEGATTGEKLTLRIWDGTAKQEYSTPQLLQMTPQTNLGGYVNYQGPLTFANNSFININLAVATGTQTTLITGWNLMGWTTTQGYFQGTTAPLSTEHASSATMSSNTMSTVFTTLGLSSTESFVIVGPDGVVYIPGSPFNTLKKALPGKAYWIYTPSDKTITVPGSALSPTDQLPLSSGWNQIAYWGTDGVAPATGFNCIDGKYDILVDEAGKVYMAGSPFNTLKTLQKNKGYFIHTTAPATLKYDCQ